MDATNVTNVASTAAQAIIDAPAYDEDYRFGRRPTTQAPFPFTDRQFARLLIARGRISAAAQLAPQLEAA